LFHQIYPVVEISHQLDPKYQRFTEENRELIRANLEQNVGAALPILRSHIRNCKTEGIKPLESMVQVAKPAVLASG
jgi:hypothetical protein